MVINYFVMNHQYLMISRCTWLIGFIFVKNDQHPRPRSSSAAETREYSKSCLQKFVFAAPQLPSTGPNLLGERLRFSSTSGGWWRVNRFRWRRWNAQWRKIALHLIRLRALEQALLWHVMTSSGHYTFLPITFDRKELDTLGKCQSICLDETHWLICNMTYLGHFRDLTWGQISKLTSRGHVMIKICHVAYVSMHLDERDSVTPFPRLKLYFI